LSFAKGLSMRSFQTFGQRNLFVLATLCASFAAVASCGGDDDTTDAGTGGSGGRGGSGGAAGKGGAAGTAGKGGSAGKDGGAGSGGTAGVGGTGGAGGSAGTAGKGGGAGLGGAAGTGGKGGAAGTAGAAGAAGKGGSAGSAPDAGADASTDGPMMDASSDADASTPTANLRFAHLSPGAPGVDFCLAVRGTTAFTGPVLAGRGFLTGLLYGTVTQYLVVGAAQYDVRIVAAGATSCATSLGGLPDATNLPAIPAGGSVTIAAEGELAPGDAGGQPFGLRAYVDDTAVATGRAKLRFVHASSGTPAVDVGLGGGVLFTSLFTNVAFGNTAAATNGYVETNPLTNAEISARVTGSMNDDVLAVKGANLAAGTIATAFAIGKVGNIVSPLKILLCADNAPPIGLLTPCNIVGDVPQRAHVRIAHLSPDAPTVDACLAPTGTMFTGTPLLRSLAVTTGLSYPQVTRYLDVPVQAYDVRFVPATATDCATAAVPDTMNVVVTNELYATLAAIGDLMVPDAGAPDAGSDPAFALRMFADNSGPPIPASNISLRFVHASPGTAAVDVGLGSAGTFTAIFGNVAFGRVAIGAGIDLNGYISTTPLANQTISVRAAGGTTDVLVVPNVTIAAGSLATVFAIGNKTGDITRPLKVLLCADNAVPAGVLTPCTVAPP
jgi:hypothetical protein